jgi:hypothetical protein
MCYGTKTPGPKSPPRDRKDQQNLDPRAFGYRAKPKPGS